MRHHWNGKGLGHCKNIDKPGHQGDDCDPAPEITGPATIILTALSSFSVVADYDAPEGFTFDLEEIGDDEDLAFWDIDPTTGALYFNELADLSNADEINGSGPDFYVIASDGTDTIRIAVDAELFLGG